MFFLFFFFLMMRRLPRSTLFPYTTLFRSLIHGPDAWAPRARFLRAAAFPGPSTSSMAKKVCSPRSEEHTSELQSRQYLVCRLLLEKKKKKIQNKNQKDINSNQTDTSIHLI